MKSNKLFIIILSLIFFALPFSSMSQTNKSQNMDIKIMEGVLDKMLEHSRSSYGWTSSTTGFYLKGFGYLFKASANESFFTEAPVIAEYKRQKLDNLREKLSENRKQVDSLRVILENFSQDRSYNTAKKKDSIFTALVADKKQKVSNFLLRYASAIQPEFPKEKIAILLDMENTSFDENSQPTLAGWAFVSDLNKYRGSANLGKGFIHFNLSNKQSKKIDQQIDIFQEILHRLITGTGIKSSSFYFKDVGALFFLDLPALVYSDSYEKSLSLIYSDEEEKDSKVFIPMTIKTGKNKNKTSAKEAKQNILKEYKDNVADAIIKYGNTIDLKESEKLIVLLNTNSSFAFMHKSSMTPTIIQVSRKDISDFVNGKISKQDLKKKIKISNY